MTGTEQAQLDGVIGEHAERLAERMLRERASGPERWANADLHDLAEFAIRDTARAALDPSAHRAAVPESVLQLARRLGERDVPMRVIVDASTRAAQMLTELVLAVLKDPRVDVQASLPTLEAMVRRGHDVGRTVNAAILTEITDTREQWARAASSDLARAVDAVLQADDDSDLPRLPAYPLDRSHVGLLAWVPDPARADTAPLTDAIARWCRSIGARASLVLPRDHQTVQVWAGCDADVQTLSEAAAAQTMPGASFALAGPSRGPAGFRRVHANLLDTRAVVSLAATPRTVTHYDEVAAICALARDPAAAADWVRQTLGGLAGNAPEQVRLRQTLRVQLANGDNASAAADVLHLHRNTVAYRLARARDLLPHGRQTRNLDLALALEYHYIVLDPPAPDG